MKGSKEIQRIVVCLSVSRASSVIQGCEERVYLPSARVDCRLEVIKRSGSHDHRLMLPDDDAGGCLRRRPLLQLSHSLTRI